jgi:hypothetical protein
MKNKTEQLYRRALALLSTAHRAQLDLLTEHEVEVSSIRTAYTDLAALVQGDQSIDEEHLESLVAKLESAQ